jgi:hypothetical protein
MMMGAHRNRAIKLNNPKRLVMLAFAPKKPHKALALAPVHA